MALRECPPTGRSRSSMARSVAVVMFSPVSRARSRAKRSARSVQNCHSERVAPLHPSVMATFQDSHVALQNVSSLKKPRWRPSSGAFHTRLVRQLSFSRGVCVIRWRSLQQCERPAERIAKIPGGLSVTPQTSSSLLFAATSVVRSRPEVLLVSDDDGPTIGLVPDLDRHLLHLELVSEPGAPESALSLAHR
jgi:hypothetical protein